MPDIDLAAFRSTLKQVGNRLWAWPDERMALIVTHLADIPALERAMESREVHVLKGLNLIREAALHLHLPTDSAKLMNALNDAGEGTEHLDAATDTLTQIVMDLDALESRPVSGNGKIAKRRMTGRHVKGKALTGKQKDALNLLVECRGNKTEAAERLGISRAALEGRLEGAKLRGELAAPRSVRAKQKLPEDKRGGALV